MRKSQIVQDEAVKDLVRNMYAKGEPVTAETFREAAKEVLGREMTKGQAGRSLKDLKADEIAASLRETVRKERERAQRAARKALEKKKKENPSDPEIE